MKRILAALALSACPAFVTNLAAQVAYGHRLPEGPERPVRERSIASSSRSMSSTMRRACSSSVAPSGVRLMRRVLRLTSETPSCASRCVRRRLTAAVVMPSSRAQADRLLDAASATKKGSSPG